MCNFPITGKLTGDFFADREKPRGLRSFAIPMSKNREITGNLRAVSSFEFRVFEFQEQNQISPRRHPFDRAQAQAAAWRKIAFGNSRALRAKNRCAMFTTLTRSFAFIGLSSEHRVFHMFTDVHHVHPNARDNFQVSKDLTVE